MADSAANARTPRKARSLEDEIAHQEARLKKLQDNLKEKKRKDYERNAKAIAALLQAEHLDQEPVEKWQQHLPTIKALMLDDSAATPTGDQKEKPAPTVPSTADAG